MTDKRVNITENIISNLIDYNGFLCFFCRFPTNSMFRKQFELPKNSKGVMQLSQKRK